MPLTLDFSSSMVNVRIPSSDIRLEAAKGFDIEFTLPAASLQFEDNLKSLILIIDNKEIMTMTFAAIMILTTLPITLIRCIFLNLKVLVLKEDQGKGRQQFKSVSNYDLLLYLFMIPLYLSLCLFCNIIVFFVLIYAFS